MNGERRELRAPADGESDTTAQNAVRERIVEAYAEYEEATETATA